MKKFVIFALGAAIGSAVTYFVMKNRYEEYTEIEEVEVEDDVVEVADETKDTKPADEKEKLKDLTKEYWKEEDAEMDDDYGKPYVISPDEFGEKDGFDTISLTYYADGVLTDELNIPIEDIEGMVTHDALKHFGEYEDDSVFVRNEGHEIDYEILKDLRKYSDVVKQGG